MAFSNIRDDLTNGDDARVEHANHHNEIADRVNFIEATFGENTIGLPAGGEETNVLRVQKAKDVAWQGSRMVTPGGRPGLVMTLVDSNPPKWDWRVPDGEEYPSSRRRVIQGDPESPWYDGPEFGAFQGFWIVDPVEYLGNNQWGENGDLWMVYDPDEEV